MIAHPVPVTVSGWTLTAAFSAAQTAIEILGGGGFLIALVKVWPRLKELTIGQRKDDLTDMRGRITELEKKVEAATQAAFTSQHRLVYAIAAVKLLMGRLAAQSPDDPAIKEARELLAAATAASPSAWPDALMAGLHGLKGTGE